MPIKVVENRHLNRQIATQLEARHAMRAHLSRVEAEFARDWEASR